MVSIKKIKIHKSKIVKHTYLYLRAGLWFAIGILLGFSFLISFAYITIQKIYQNKVLPGVMVAGVNMGGKTEADVINYFEQKNQNIAQTTFTLASGVGYATISAQEIHLGYNAPLLAQQAMSVGRSSDIFSQITIVFETYLFGTSLAPSYSFSDTNLRATLAQEEQIIHKAPVDAQFTQGANGRVTTFIPSINGQDIDYDVLTQVINQKIPFLIDIDKPQEIHIDLPIKILEPKITTEKANSFGIKELIGAGTSLFQHSIPSRIYNVELAASRINGVVVAPNEEFSFDRALGDVSSYTGYQQAYIISGGRTVLGDGGGVCQVSTTLFRAILNAGLPITERHAHDYRVGYYEEDGPPGLDATVYVPTVDLKFKNTTGNNILIQSVVDPDTLRLTFYLYGVKDGREVTLTTPIVTNQTPAPAPLYQDDPALPKGQTKQIDFSADGATVTFNRIVVQNGKQIINETYVSNYRPWQAIYLVGTK